MFNSSMRRLNTKVVSSGCKAIGQCSFLRVAGYHCKILSSVHATRTDLGRQCSAMQPYRYMEHAAKDSVSYSIGSLFGNFKKFASRYMVQGLASKNLYECCADQVSYKEFFIACNMPDTFQSWFYIMHLHLWMLLVRLKPEGKFGKNLSYYMVELMWKDVEERIKLMGVEDTSERKETMDELAQQFFGMIIAYDEGLLGHDILLSSALWRNLFYNKQSTDAESLASMVGYVRKQIQYLEEQNSEEILNGKVKWLPFLEEDSTKAQIPDPG